MKTVSRKVVEKETQNHPVESVVATICCTGIYALFMMTLRSIYVETLDAENDNR